MKHHISITLPRISEAVQRANTTLDNPGFCVACGEETEGCEPDACNYTCEVCGEDQVFGAQELLMMLAIE